MIRIGNDWDEVLEEEFEKDYFKELEAFLAREYETQTIYPDRTEIYSALAATPFHSVRAVILGQDPYHGAGQAHGMCFSVRPGIRIPPSLGNIFKELEVEFGYPRPDHGCLSDWAKEGVLLLNAILTVRAKEPMSHQDRGWERFTDAIIEKLGQRETPLVFLLWGAPAQKKARFLDKTRHLVLATTHPSPLSAYRGFLGCGHFKAANQFLQQHGQGTINWQIR